ncbi:hypothetical protein SAICODRAFT_119618 [Saitoella complicata NRRL Y-17804]|uniref:uncharacterized protein n=1 Tax=Saitoella complicata (strain BCRC 22490 / CBS 7301 / JCM 7358 / NBRC 10748 / NRRL Y-17804) TaxID=698492 RepID=UPI0008669BEE|nr:uncharacterized protein SAICODRAFT_119618 [Saitoella complicata NRRL Y-17804]ODQ53260.1 hypothetical protein SAICODRAFT_119618 [Saitoella complicata NRRL Y-17804]
MGTTTRELSQVLRSSVTGDGRRPSAVPSLERKGEASVFRKQWFSTLARAGQRFRNVHAREGVSNSTTRRSNNHLITDGARKFFKIGQLLITSTYHVDMQRWVPVLISWAGGETVGHYAAHFTALFRSILEVTPDAPDTWFANVVDFSETQRLGYMQAFMKVRKSPELYWLDHP